MIRLAFYSRNTRICSRCYVRSERNKCAYLVRTREEAFMLPNVETNVPTLHV